MTNFDQRGQKVVASIDWVDSHSLRAWWHGVLRDYGKYASYAFFLILPSDKETIRYLIEYGKEIDSISGKDCLVLTLCKTEITNSNLSKDDWEKIIQEYSVNDYSVKVAQLFEIPLDKLPCLLLFKDIRSPEHALITLEGLNAEEISRKMRAFFSTLHTAVKNKDNPITAVLSHKNKDVIKKTGKNLAIQAGVLSEKTFEAAIEALMKVVIK